MRDTLNKKANFSSPCRCLPNGFYNPADMPIIADASKKENVIITVGRLGTEQKNNMELVVAFAAASELKDWRLKLIGNTEPELVEHIQSHIAARPDLKDRIILTGAIYDKAALYDEYAKAKVFALTSVYEGGAPNVYAEALFHGCKFVTSDIDAADDMTNFGELGEKYTLGEVRELVGALVRVCRSCDEDGMKKHIPKALAYANRHYDWNRNIRKLTFALLK